MEHVRFNIDCDNPNDAYRLLKSLKEFWAKPTNGKVKVTIIKSDNSCLFNAVGCALENRNVNIS